MEKTTNSMNTKIKIETITKKVMRGEFHNEEVPIYITTDNNRHTTEENANNHQNYLDKIEELKKSINYKAFQTDLLIHYFGGGDPHCFTFDNHGKTKEEIIDLLYDLGVGNKEKGRYRNSNIDPEKVKFNGDGRYVVFYYWDDGDYVTLYCHVLPLKDYLSEIQKEVDNLYSLEK